MNEPTYDLQAERVLNVSQEAAFDAYTSPALWSALGADSVCDLRVGGDWTIVGGAPHQPYREENHFIDIDRPRHIAFTSTLFLPGDTRHNRNVDATFVSDGAEGTKMTIVQKGFPNPQSRDALAPAFPHIFDALERTVQASHT